MTSNIETIKTKVDIIDEIGLVVALQRSGGKSLKGLCPFHNERTPSFYVFRETQTWHCFGCNEGGDIFSFVQKHQGLDFREALTYLAEKAGVPLEETGLQTDEDREVSSARERLFKLNEEAQLWFHQMLLRAREAEAARAYVQSRGITTETIVTFGLGYASENWDSLTRYLLSRGYSEEELVAGGLARWRESDIQPGRREGIYDYFRQRLMFPIRDQRGRVIGFGGRALGENKPKYLNSPQTVLFEKNTVLFAMDQARDAIKQANQVIIVEGYVDAIIAHQYGTKQTVACIGSAITEKHIQQLKKLTKQVTLALDPDAAGNAATEQGIQEALKGFDKTVLPVPLPRSSQQASYKPQKGEKKHSRISSTSRGIIRLEEQVDAEINVLQLPPGEDPDEFIRRDPSAWYYAVAHPLTLIDYFFVAKTADLHLQEPGARAEASKRLLPLIALIRDRAKRDVYIRKLATLIRVNESSLHFELQQVIRAQKHGGIVVDLQQGEPDGRKTFYPGKQERGAAHSQPVHSNHLFGESGDTSQPETNKGLPQHEAVLDREKKNAVQWEDYLIGLLLHNPALSQYVCGIISDGDFAGTDTRELYHILNSVYQRDASPSLQSIEQLVPSALLPTVARATKYLESKSPLDDAGLIKEATQCAARLKRSRLLQLNTELQYLVQEARVAGDKAAERQLSRQVMENIRQLHTIESAVTLHG